MKPKPTVGDAVRVSFPAEVIECKPGAVVCCAHCSGGLQVQRFGPDGRGHNGARMKRAKRAGVAVTGVVE